MVTKVGSYAPLPNSRSRMAVDGYLYCTSPDLRSKHDKGAVGLQSSGSCGRGISIQQLICVNSCRRCISIQQLKEVSQYTERQYGYGMIDGYRESFFSSENLEPRRVRISADICSGLVRGCHPREWSDHGLVRGGQPREWSGHVPVQCEVVNLDGGPVMLLCLYLLLCI